MMENFSLKLHINSILFSDKTGTITKGKLEVVEFFDGTLEDSYEAINVQNYFQLISSYKIPMQKEKTLTQILV